MAAPPPHLRPAPAPPRPTLLAQQSSSLPSTPLVHPRELPPDFHVAPSPIPPPHTSTDHLASPRSARSESDGTLRLPGRSTFLAGCPFETGMAFSRRRFPYSPESGPLPHEAPPAARKRLEPAVERRVTADMQALYAQLLPSADDDARRARFVAKLERILNERWPGNDIQVHVFGSSGNLLCTKDSDGGCHGRLHAKIVFM